MATIWGWAMPGFRLKKTAAATSESSKAGMSPVAIRRLIAEVLSPAHFFASEAIVLDWEQLEQEEQSWEIFQGRLLDPADTRERRTFESWNLYQVDESGRSGEPLLAVKLDSAAAKLFVVRGIYCYAWEAYDAGGNVILTRETKKWVRELVGIIDLSRFAKLEELRDEVICQLFQAVVGKSRLPLTSVEAPLPGFSLGSLAYFYRGRLNPEETSGGPARSFQQLLERNLNADLAWIEKAKLLETFLHVVRSEEIGVATECFVRRWLDIGHSAEETISLMRTLFNEVALSPYTDLVDKALAFLHSLVGRRFLSSHDQADFLTYLLRQQGRHLTAYDLITFHQRGANYPDALLVDAVLKGLLALADSEPNLFLDDSSDSEPVKNSKRLRRRGVRQGWLLRCRYQNHAVPDAPTSEGENYRVLPSPHHRVPEEQILESRRRKKRLFLDDPLTSYLVANNSAILGKSLVDLHDPRELRELGMALFLDRPLGSAKAPAEPDHTLLMSYEAFSAALVQQRLDYMAKGLNLLTTSEWEALRNRLQHLKVNGLPVSKLRASLRPSVVSLQDAGKVASDFVLVRTTPSTAAAFLGLFDWSELTKRFALDFLNAKGDCLILRGMAEDPDAITIHDNRPRPRIELTVNASSGYASRAGCDYPVAGLRAECIWEEKDDGSLEKRSIGQNPCLVMPSC